MQAGTRLAEPLLRPVRYYPWAPGRHFVVTSVTVAVAAPCAASPG